MAKEKRMRSERWIRTDTILPTAGFLLIGYFIGNVLLLVFAAVLIAVGFDGLVRAAPEFPSPQWQRPTGGPTDTGL